VIVSGLTFTIWRIDSVSGTFVTVVWSLRTGITSVITNDDLSRTDWNINNGGGLDDVFWWDTTWWHNQVSGTSDTVIWGIDTSGTFIHVTRWTFSN
jgi:hypothetical protein